MRPCCTPGRAYSKLGGQDRCAAPDPAPWAVVSRPQRLRCTVICVRAGRLAQSPPDRSVCWILGLRYQHSPAPGSDARHTVRLHKGQIKAAPAFVSQFCITMSYMYIHLVRYRPCKNPTMAETLAHLNSTARVVSCRFLLAHPKRRRPSPLGWDGRCCASCRVDRVPNTNANANA